MVIAKRKTQRERKKGRKEEKNKERRKERKIQARAESQKQQPFPTIQKMTASRSVLLLLVGFFFFLVFTFLQKILLKYWDHTMQTTLQLYNSTITTLLFCVTSFMNISADGSRFSENSLHWIQTRTHHNILIHSFPIVDS